MLKKYVNSLIDKVKSFFKRFELQTSDDDAISNLLHEIDENAARPEYKPRISKKQKRKENFEKFRAHKEQEKIWQQKHAKKSIEKELTDLGFRKNGAKLNPVKYKLPFDKNTPCPEVMDHAYHRFNKRIQKISKLEMQKWFGKVWKEVMSENHNPEMEPKVIYARYKNEMRPYIKCGAPETNKVVYLALSKSLDGVLTVLDSRCWYRNIKQERC